MIISSYEKQEEQDVELVRAPEGGFYAIHGDPAETELFYIDLETHTVRSYYPDNVRCMACCCGGGAFCHAGCRYPGKA